MIVARVSTIALFVLMFVLGLLLSPEQVLLMMVGGLVTTLAIVAYLIGWPMNR